MKYTLTPLRNGKYRLTIWEPAPVTEERQQPFSWKMQQTCSSVDEAIALLQQYQHLYLLSPAQPLENKAPIKPCLQPKKAKFPIECKFNNAPAAKVSLDWQLVL